MLDRPISRFTGGSESARQKLNELVDAVNTLLSIQGDGLVSVVRGSSGMTLRLAVDALLPRIPKVQPGELLFCVAVEKWQSELAEGGGAWNGQHTTRGWVKAHRCDAGGNELSSTDCWLYLPAGSDDDGLSPTAPNAWPGRIIQYASGGVPIASDYAPPDEDPQNPLTVLGSAVAGHLDAHFGAVRMIATSGLAVPPGWMSCHGQGTTPNFDWSYPIGDPDPDSVNRGSQAGPVSGGVDHMHPIALEAVEVQSGTGEWVIKQVGGGYGQNAGGNPNPQMPNDGETGDVVERVTFPVESTYVHFIMRVPPYMAP